MKQFLADTRMYLHQMLRTINIKEEVSDEIIAINSISCDLLGVDNITICCRLVVCMETD